METLNEIAKLIIFTGLGFSALVLVIALLVWAFGPETECPRCGRHTMVKLYGEEGVMVCKRCNYRVSKGENEN